MFNSKKDKKIKEYEQIIVALKKQNNVLKVEIGRLEQNNQRMLFYKNQYALLCEEIKNLKKKYKEKLEAFEELEKEYKKYLLLLKKKH